MFLGEEAANSFLGLHTTLPEVSFFHKASRESFVFIPYTAEIGLERFIAILRGERQAVRRLQRQLPAILHQPTTEHRWWEPSCHWRQRRMRRRKSSIGQRQRWSWRQSQLKRWPNPRPQRRTERWPRSVETRSRCRCSGRGLRGSCERKRGLLLDG